jgi:uncharacterized membrane protein
MPVIEAQTTINVPVDKTFAIFSDFQNLPGILNQAQIIRFLSEQKTGLGTKWEQTPIDSEHNNINIHEVVEFTPEKSLSITSLDQISKESFHFTFTPQGDRTLVTFKLDAKGTTFLAKLAAPLLKGMIKDNMTQDLQRMKEHIESQI